MVASKHVRRFDGIQCQVSIPFIAGQWSLPCTDKVQSGHAFWSQSPSLRGSGRFTIVDFLMITATTCLNPLHCGAVVASFYSVEYCFKRNKSLNPLHCGAVVASRDWRLRNGRGRKVSIPFIAGQWSLLPPRPCGLRDLAASQSPSLRGSGRFSKLKKVEFDAEALVSIPFIAGQWSLPGRDRR